MSSLSINNLAHLKNFSLLECALELSECLNATLSAELAGGYLTTERV